MKKKRQDKVDIDWIKVRDVCLNTMSLVGELLKLSPQYQKQGDVLSQAVQTTKLHLGLPVDRAWLISKQRLLDEQLAIVKEQDPEIYEQIQDELEQLQEITEGIEDDESDEDDTV